MNNEYTNFSAAINEFYRARNQAQLKEIIARLRGETNQLLNYDEVRKRLHAQGAIDRGLKEIPITSIIGSCGRYNDFTRDFLPKKDSIKDRWARVRTAVTGVRGLPPIEVYKIGDAYFVKDGNHRVSVARQLGMAYIQAYVTEVHSRVPLSPEITPDSLIIAEEYVHFLEKTRLDSAFPGLDLSVSIPGQYAILEEHISVHRYFMGLEQKREISYPEAALDWYQNYYLPIAKKIEELGILRSYPQRTVTDLYLFISENQAELEKKLGWQIGSDRAMISLIETLPQDFQNWWTKFFMKLDGFLFKGKFSPGPPPGEWRQMATTIFPKDALIQDILVPIDGEEGGWLAIQQAIQIAERENAAIHAIHVTNQESNEIDAESLHTTYDQLFNHSSLTHDLVITQGNIADSICSRSRYIDLVVLNLRFPPGPLPLDRLTSGFHELVQKCPRPILAIPQKTSPLTKALLAYAAGPKSNEALFMASYLAQKWNIGLTVLSVEDNRNQAKRNLAIVKKHLTYRKIQAQYIEGTAPVASTVLTTAEKHGCDFIITGGYGYNPLIEIMLGSVVDEILRNTNIPLLICR
jgi:nucleotide-binding universal stress UspA family protein